MNRRTFLAGTAAIGALMVGGGSLLELLRVVPAEAASFPVSKTDDEWRKVLSEQQYSVLREEGTEYAGSSPLNHEKRKGVFHCAGCAQPVYSSDTKFDSGTGWPSFWQAIDKAVGTKEDNSLFMQRIEVHCSSCGGHLGHVFDDGPPPTGKRHCINGVALNFTPASAA